MSASGHTAGHAAKSYFNYTYHPNRSAPDYLRWAATLPFRSYLGARAIARYATGPAPAQWKVDFADRRALIVGSGPSLDKVDDSFFERFDTIVYMNFALTRARGGSREYFFTTDSGPICQFIDAHGAGPFRRLGRDRCIFAPVFQDQWQGFTPEGRELVTWIGCDAAGWRLDRARLGRLSLPVIARYHPVQPDWSRFALPRSPKRIPVLDHTSALSAVIFAAANGSGEIGLIGCDFSAGRAASVESTQVDPGAVFAGAGTEFSKMAHALGRQGIDVTNHSWSL